MAGTEAARQAIWFHDLLEEINGSKCEKVVIRSDKTISQPLHLQETLCFMEGANIFTLDTTSLESVLRKERLMWSMFRGLRKRQIY